MFLAEPPNRSRDVLGLPFDAANPYDENMRDIYATFMDETLRLAERVRDAGYHQQIYPQGATSSQLTPGKTGAVQAALALGLPIVPVGSLAVARSSSETPRSRRAAR